MLFDLFQSLLRVFAPAHLTELFLWLVVVLFGFSVYWRRTGRVPSLTAHAPTLLASLGILGTFVGIVVGLLDFDPSDLDGSIDGLLAGLTTAFVSSITGLSASLVFRWLDPWLRSRRPTAAPQAVGPEQVVAILDTQRRLLKEVRDAIAGSEESSVAGQLKLLRTDLSDRQRAEAQFRERFENTLWRHLKEFADTLSKSATEQVIDALNKVIADFNRNLTEQFGENFKKLDDSVGKLVDWQDRYRRQLTHLHSLYEQSVQSIQTVEASVRQIADQSAAIPKSMAELARAVATAREATTELERHLVAFAELRDKAVEAIPQTQTHVEAMTRDIAASVNVAGERLTALQKAADAQQEQARQKVEELARAAAALQGTIQQVQDRVAASAETMQTRVASSVEAMQSKIERTLETALSAQTRATNELAQSFADNMSQVVARTGDGVTAQLNALDQAQKQHLTAVMQRMANALGQIAGKFVEDYSKLVHQMNRIVQRGRTRR